MGAMVSQISSLAIVSQPFIRAQIKVNIKTPRHWPLCGGPVNSPHKGPVTRKMFPFDDVIMDNQVGNKNLFELHKTIGMLDDYHFENFLSD